jgi:hypothetical protein
MNAAERRYIAAASVADLTDGTAELAFGCRTPNLNQQQPGNARSSTSDAMESYR